MKDAALIAAAQRVEHYEMTGYGCARTYLSDARHIRQMAQDAQKAVVIGGSFIGMEAASVLQSQGIETTLIFPEARVWASFFTPEMSTFFEKYYRERGVTLLSGEEVTSFKGDEHDRVQGVITKSGQQISSDLVVAGIGVRPNSEVFDGQLAMKEGTVLVNRFLESSLADVWAAGDITSYRDMVYDRVLHIEHWDNAVKQGEHAARGLLGQRQPFEHVPYGGVGLTTQI